MRNSCQIENLSSDPVQTHTLLTDIDDIELTLTFHPSISAWNMDITYRNIAINGVAVSLNVPLLHDSRLPFTIVAVARDNRDIEPSLLDDFASGRVVLYLLVGEEEKEAVY
ncbi:phage baseplate plug family protein [Arsenophonus sp. PmNCSU2021_1]|uniref:phage baseplate plug family protein n=1 Tax=Arsenophonus sp. PmNCSU2021_1 TaxID=3118989 RepID=UPI002FF070C6